MSFSRCRLVRTHCGLLSLFSLSLLIVCLLCAVTSAAAASNRSLLQIQILHRHGARLPPRIVDGSLTWSEATLTDAGEQMGLQLGVALRERYASFLTQLFSTNGSSPEAESPALFVPAPSSTFPTSAVGPISTQPLFASRSTQISRTIQTGLAMLSTFTGLEVPQSNNTSSSSPSWQLQDANQLPYLDHMSPMSSDFLLAFASNFPARQLTAASYWKTFFNNSDGKVETALGGPAEVAKLQALFPEVCASQGLVMCALYAEDLAQCQFSNGGIPQELLELFPGLLRLQMELNQMTLGFDKNNSSSSSSAPFAPAGAVGYPLASRMLTNAREVLDQFQTPMDDYRSTQLLHYSAHDNTIVGLWAALGILRNGDPNTTLWVPRFAQTVILELYTDGNVSFVWGLPELAAGSSFSFDPLHRFEALELQCQRAAATGEEAVVYRATECPLQELIAFVEEYSSPTDPWVRAQSSSLTSSSLLSSSLQSSSSGSSSGAAAAAACYVPPAMYQELCGTGQDQTVSHACRTYRQACPLVACGPAAVLNLTDGNCWPLPVKPSKPSFGAVAAPALCSAAGAMIFGLFLGVLLRKWLPKEDTEHPGKEVQVLIQESQHEHEGDVAGASL